MAKEIYNDEQLREKIMAGVDALADTIKVTLGPAGRNVVIDSQKAGLIKRTITNDGATIARGVNISDRAEFIGAQLVREVSTKTEDAAGDGTTTAVVLAQSILKEGYRMVAAGANPVELRKGILGGAQVAAGAIRKSARPIKTQEEIAQVAVISCGDTQLGEMVAEAVHSVGPDGVITVEESNTMMTELNLKDGMQLDHGFKSNDFTTDELKTVAEIENPYILVTDEKISNAYDILPLLEEALKENAWLVIIAEEVSDTALAMLTLNYKSGQIKVCVIDPPAYGDGRIWMMEDVAYYTGGQFITSKMGLRVKDTKLSMLGRARSVRVERDGTAIVGGAGGEKAFKERISYLRNLIEKTDYDFNRKRFQERLARFVSGTAVISVGGTTEVEMRERKLRIDDAVAAARAAVREGIMPGGGVAFLHVYPAVEAYRNSLEGDKRTGADILLRALEAPARQIAQNAGYSGDATIAEIRRAGKGMGLQAETGEIVNMFEAGIVDPALVSRMCILNAASISAVLLTTNAGVVEIVEKPEEGEETE